MQETLLVHQDLVHTGGLNELVVNLRIEGQTCLHQNACIRLASLRNFCSADFFMRLVAKSIIVVVLKLLVHNPNQHFFKVIRTEGKRVLVMKIDAISSTSTDQFYLRYSRNT